MGGKVSKQLEQSKYTNELDIGYLNLRSLPVQVASLLSVESIKAPANRLSRIEKSHLDRLKKLKRLDLAGNKFSKLPGIVTNLPTLEHLNMGFNQIAQIPLRLNLLVNLTSVILSGNKLQSLPDIFAAFPRLVELKVDKNQLSDLPPSLASCPLKTLVITENAFKKIPEVLAKVSVEEINLNGGDITELPAAFVVALSKNESVRVLNLSSNQIKSVPDCLPELFELREINLSKNPIKDWPEKAKKMMNLKYEFDELMKKDLWAK